MTQVVPRRPSGSSMKRFDYAEVIAYFKSKHRLKTDAEFFSRLTTGNPSTRFFVVDIMDVLVKGTDEAAVVAGLFQKEYKDQIIVLDMVNDKRKRATGFCSAHRFPSLDKDTDCLQCFPHHEGAIEQ